MSYVNTYLCYYVFVFHLISYLLLGPSCQELTVHDPSCTTPKAPDLISRVLDLDSMGLSQD